MIKNSYKVIGVMSGTSLDGLDLAYIKLDKNSHWKYDILEAETYEYEDEWEVRLSELTTMSKEYLSQIDLDYTDYLVKKIQEFIQNNNIRDIDAICSHGHTALHQPEKGITVQIGNREDLGKALKNTVVCDFRIQDVGLGGQGAPLVPIGDELLFSEYDFCLNLGGFANVSFNDNGKRLAFDICPVNIVLNAYCRELGFNYDDQGQISASGSLHLELLNQLNRLEFYKSSHPKSLGLEWVQNNVFPIIDSYSLKTKDILRTFVEHSAIQIASILNTKAKASTLVTGGGAYHRFLIDRIKTHSTSQLVVPDKQLIEYKEALVFGLLGVLKLRDEINCLSSVTGARQDHSSGKIYKF